MTAFEAAWDSVQKIDMARAEQARIIEATDPSSDTDTMVDVKVEPDYDPCCIEAFQATLVGGLQTGYYGMFFVDWEEVVNEADGEDPCAWWRGFLEDMERIAATHYDDDMPANPELEAKVRQILSNWDACSAKSWSGDFTASKDSFDDAWAVVKEEEDPHADIPEEHKGGECYMCAGRHVWSNPETHTLVHANVTGQGQIEGVRYGHAFTEFEGDNGMAMVHDPSADVTLPADFYYHLGQINPDEVRRYSHDEMNTKLQESKIWGPWDD